MIDQIAYLASHPQAIIYAVSTALLYPVLFIEVAALTWAVFEAGMFTYEMVRRGRKKPLALLDTAAESARYELKAGRPEGAIAALRGITRGTWTRRFFSALDPSRDFERTRLLKRLTDLESDIARALERTRVLVRLGPMLGLMGTLIPISPALIALAQGDVQTLSDNLVVAFSTTVVGLLIGGIAFLVSAVRDRVYTLDVSDIEYVLDSLDLP